MMATSGAARRLSALARHFTAASVAATRTKEVALVIGAGDATGASAAKAFAREGFTVVAVRRNKGASVGGTLDDLVQAIKSEGGECHGYALDARREEQVPRCAGHCALRKRLSGISGARRERHGPGC